MIDPGPGDQATIPPGEFVPISEAARRLGINLRTLYRHVKRLSDSDTILSRDGKRLVRLSSLSNLRSDALPVTDSVTTRHDNDTSRHDNVTELSLLREIINRQDSENAALRAALEREQGALRDALAEVKASREQYAVLIAAMNARQVEPARKPSDTPENAQEPQEGASGPVEGKGIDPSSPPRKRWWWPFGTGAGA